MVWSTALQTQRASAQIVPSLLGTRTLQRLVWGSLGFYFTFYLTGSWFHYTFVDLLYIAWSCLAFFFCRLLFLVYWYLLHVATHLDGHWPSIPFYLGSPMSILNDVRNQDVPGDSPATLSRIFSVINIFTLSKSMDGGNGSLIFLFARATSNARLRIPSVGLIHSVFPVLSLLLPSDMWLDPPNSHEVLVKSFFLFHFTLSSTCMIGAGLLWSSFPFGFQNSRKTESLPSWC